MILRLDRVVAGPHTLTSEDLGHGLAVESERLPQLVDGLTVLVPNDQLGQLIRLKRRSRAGASDLARRSPRRRTTLTWSSRETPERRLGSRRRSGGPPLRSSLPRHSPMLSRARACATPGRITDQPVSLDAQQSRLHRPLPPGRHSSNPFLNCRCRPRSVSQLPSSRVRTSSARGHRDPAPIGDAGRVAQR